MNILSATFPCGARAGIADCTLHFVSVGRERPKEGRNLAEIMTKIPDSAFIHRVRGGFDSARGNAVERVLKAVFSAKPFVEAVCAVCSRVENRV